MKKKIKESPPQHEFYKMLKAFLASDPTVEVGDLYDPKAEHIAFDIKISDPKKFFAFKTLLKLHDNFGGLEYTINLVPSNEAVLEQSEKYGKKLGFDGRKIKKSDKFYASIGKVLKDFFKDNTAFSKVKVVKNVMSQRRDVFLVLWPDIVQYWADNIGSCYGLNTETYEQVAKKVLRDDVFFFICSERTI